MIGDRESAFKIDYLRAHKRDTYYGSRISSPKANNVECVAAGISPATSSEFSISVTIFHD